MPSNEKPKLDWTPAVPFLWDVRDAAFEPGCDQVGIRVRLNRARLWVAAMEHRSDKMFMRASSEFSTGQAFEHARQVAQLRGAINAMMLLNG